MQALSPAGPDVVEERVTHEERLRLLEIVLPEQETEPPPQAVAAHGPKGALAAGPREGDPETSIDSEAEPNGVLDGPECAGRIVRERARVEEPEAPPFEIPFPVEWIEKRAQGPVGREASRHRVNREVPAPQVLGDRNSGHDDRKRAGPRISFRPAGREVDTQTLRSEERRRPESPVRSDEGPARNSRQRRREVKRAVRRTFDRDINVLRRATKEKIADRTSDDVNGKARFCRDASHRRENPDELCLLRRNSLLLPESYGVAYWYRTDFGPRRLSRRAVRSGVGLTA